MIHTLVFHTIKLGKKLQHSMRFKDLGEDLSTTQISAILIIASSANVTQKEISGQLHLKPASVVPLIDCLENRGLLSRHATESDRRKYHIHLTKKGEQIASAIELRMQKINKILTKLLSKEEAKIFNRTVYRLSDFLDSTKGGEHEISSTKRSLAA